jgi:hypothetical protein
VKKVGLSQQENNSKNISGSNSIRRLLHLLESLSSGLAGKSRTPSVFAVDTNWRSSSMRTTPLSSLLQTERVTSVGLPLPQRVPTYTAPAKAR